MKRDMNLIRRIVIEVQDLPAIAGKPRDLPTLGGLNGVDPALFAAHVQLLTEAGLVKSAMDGDDRHIPRNAHVFRLTWAGHEFADSIRDETLWNRAVDHVIKPSASWTFGLLVEYLKVEARRRIGFPE